MKGILTILFFSITILDVAAQSANSYILKGNALYEESKFDQAEIQYRMALEADPKNITAKYNLANALQKQNKYNEALTLLEQVTAATTDKKLKASAYYNHGVAHTKLKNLESSIESYKNALRNNPDDKEARENLQKALRELKKNQSQSQSQSQSKMSQKEAEQKLKQLQQKEKELQQRMQNKNKEGSGSQAEDW
jgi:Ca-activated chloride channel homolog